MNISKILINFYLKIFLKTILEKLFSKTVLGRFQNRLGHIVEPAGMTWLIL